MPAIVWILLVLAIALSLVVVLTQRYGRPMGGEQQQRLGKILMVLVFVLLVARLVAELF